MTAAPDFVEPFEGWRVWRVVRRDGQYSLRSVVQRTLWPAGEALAAECLGARRLVARLGRRPRHEAPEAGCDCGIYGAGLEYVGQYAAGAYCRGAGRVLGRVALWGTVVECERGLRASYAYPSRIYVPVDAGDPWRAGWDEVAIDLARYGVPVEPVASRAADATHDLAERRAA